jgi:PAS domain S-box-containing protein
MLQNGPTARDLTARYILALSIVALLSSVGQVLIQYEMVRQSSDAHVINVAGRQRMLSQRLSKAALELRAYPALGDVTPVAHEFRETLRVWERSHEDLQHGSLDRSLPGRNSPEVRALFATGERYFQAMRQAGWELAAVVGRRAAPAADLAEPVSTILANQGPFLHTMDRIVLQYQHEAERKVRALKVIELCLFSLTLVVLTAEGLLVFRPAVRRVAHTIAELTRVQLELRKSQAELETKVEQRTADLRKSEQAFRTIFESASVGVAQVDPRDGRFLRVNPTLCAITQYSEDELLHKTFSEITHPDERDADFAHFQRMVRGEIPRYEAQKRYVRRDGRAVWAQVSVTLLRDAAGVPERTVSIVHDISTRVEAERALRRSEEHFRTLAEAVPQIVWTADAELRVNYFNRRWSEYTGMAPALPSTSALRAVVHPAERARLDGLWEDARRRGLPFEIEHRLRAADGSYRWHLTRGLPLFDEQHRAVRWFGSCTDIEDQKQSQLAAEGANRSKDEFVALISHELRTPLMAILGWAAAMRERRADPDLVARATNIIQHNAQTQAQLVEDLLDMSRIISGKMEIEQRPTDVDAAVTAALDTVRPAADRKHIRLDVVHADVPTPVMGDAQRLQQVFWNLLSNAIKFTPEDGRVEVRVEATDRVHVSVCDNGRGIDPRFLPHVFERFQQAQQGSARSHGLGLGLAIVRQLVELHDGSISAQSEGEGRGACFVVELPMLPAESGAADLHPRH